LQRLLASLPAPIRRSYERVTEPRMLWLRVPLSLLLIAGGLVGFLPVLGFWMVPLGLLLMAEDVPFLRRPTMKTLAAVQRGWDRYSRRRKSDHGAVTSRSAIATDPGERCRGIGADGEGGH
jgi:hypothetical protein